MLKQLKTQALKEISPGSAYFAEIISFTMGKELYYLLALSAGIAVAIQAGVNSQLKLAVGNPVITALLSFCIGTIALLLVVLISYRQEFPSLGQLQGISPWKWTGGLLGVLYVTAVILAAPRIGAANTLGIIVAGQLLAAIVLDHYGWLGFPVKTINWSRVLGAMLLLAGVFLLRKA